MKQSKSASPADAPTKRLDIVHKPWFAPVITLLVGIAVGTGATLFFQNYNPPDADPTSEVSVVFDRIISQNEMVSASQNYSIVEKSTDSNRLFDLVDVPFTENSFWYRYAGTLKAGVDLETATYELSETVITVSLHEPHIVSNTVDTEKSGVLEENNNVLNPIHVEDIDAFQKQCAERSESEAVEQGLLDEARLNAENNIRGMFTAALGEEFTVEFKWVEDGADAAPAADEGQDGEQAAENTAEQDAGQDDEQAAGQEDASK